MSFLFCMTIKSSLPEIFKTLSLRLTSDQLKTNFSPGFQLPSILHSGAPGGTGAGLICTSRCGNGISMPSFRNRL
jgi:hypothetical protein